MRTFRDGMEKLHKDAEAGKEEVKDGSSIVEPVISNEESNEEPISSEAEIKSEEKEPIEKEQSFDDWLSSAPEEYRKEISVRVGAGVQKYVNDTYGELLDFLPELAEDKELQKQVAKLSKKEFRDFIMLKEAYDIFEGTPEEKLAQVDAIIPKEYEEKLNASQEKIRQLEQEKIDRDHNDKRREEVIELLREVPELQYTKQDKSDPGWVLLNHLFDQAESKRISNYSRGIYNDDVPLKRIYKEWKEISNNKVLTPNIPTTSTAGPPKMPAKNEVEFREQRIQEIKKAGGVTAYAKLHASTKK